MAEDAGDDHPVNSEIEVIVGPRWREVKQCSPVVAPRAYWNSNADEDDQQQWIISPCGWEVVDTGGGKRIRPKFTMTQLGEKTKFYGIAYQVTATGAVFPGG
jgi:hypothetical protein